jgi:head-tail adaptor
MDTYEFFLEKDIVNELLRNSWLDRENIYKQRQKLPSPALLKEAETLYYDHKLEQWKSTRRIWHRCNHSKYFMSTSTEWVLHTFSIQFDLVTEKTGTLLINDDIQFTRVRESTVNKFIVEILEDICWW